MVAQHIGDADAAIPAVVVKTQPYPEERRPIAAESTLHCDFSWQPENRKGLAGVGQALGVVGGANRDRTGDLYNAIVALSQLSYGPADGRWPRRPLSRN